MNLFLIILLIFLFSSFIGLYKVFEKAGYNSSLAFIPGYNYFIWMKIIEKPWWWILILIFPGVNLIMFAVFTYNTSVVFNKRSRIDMLLAAFLPFIALPYIAFNASATFVGYPKEKKKDPIKEWIDALVFAVVAASIIRGYFLEAFTIPTSSMEKDLLIGDYLFVSKMHYGAKIPQTPLSLPFTHNNLPFSYIPSYFKDIKIPYTRLPKFTDIKRFDRVVFNFPTGDTAILGFTPQTQELQGHNYYQIIRDQAYNLFQIEQQKLPSQLSPKDNASFILNKGIYEERARKNLLENKQYTYLDYNRGGFGMLNTQGYAIRPIDKKENYIKRCVALPGDVLELKNGLLHINGKLNEVENTQHHYQVVFNRTIYKKERLSLFKKQFNINNADITQINDQNGYIINTNEANFKKMETFFSSANNLKNKGLNIVVGQKVIYPKTNTLNPRREIYPNHESFNWTQDNFGPLWMPEEGASIELSDSTYHLYKRCIQEYEGNTITKKADGFYINGEKASSYTFKQGYYYLVGDNRHNSADSRFWGFVPHDHIVGKAVFIWMSLDNDLGWADGKIRWDRFFTIVHD